MGGVVRAVKRVVSSVFGGGDTTTTEITNPVTAAELVPSTASEKPEAADINTGSDKKKRGKSALTIASTSGSSSGGGYTGLNI